MLQRDLWYTREVSYTLSAHNVLCTQVFMPSGEHFVKRVVFIKCLPEFTQYFLEDNFVASASCQSKSFIIVN